MEWLSPIIILSIWVTSICWWLVLSLFFCNDHSCIF